MGGLEINRDDRVDLKVEKGSGMREERRKFRRRARCVDVAKFKRQKVKGEL